MKEALVLVDIQNDYFEGGRYPLFQADIAGSKASEILKYFRSSMKPVIFIQHIHIKSNATFFLPNTSGCEIHICVKPKDNEKIVIKHFPNSFRDTELHKVLQELGVEHIVVCGMMSHMCVDTTVRAAKDLNYSVTVIEDACTTRNLDWMSELIPALTVHRSFMSALDGTFAKVVTAKEYLYETVL